MIYRLKSVAFFVCHTVAHFLFYLVPRFAYKSIVEWPLTIVEAAIGEQRTFGADDSIVKVVAHWRNAATAELFGIEGPLTYTCPLYNGHFGTLGGAFRVARLVEYERRSARGFDGCELCLDWAMSKDPARGILVILPGLSSCSATGYITNYVLAAVRCGFHSVVLNTRGMGTTPMTTSRLMSGASTGDLRHVLQTSLSRERILAEFGSNLPIVAVGFSLGGNVLCKYVGEQGLRAEDARLDAAIAICAPWDFHEAAQHMSRVTQLVVYQPHLLKGLVNYLIRHRTVLKQDSCLAEIIESGVLSQLRTVQQFDENVIVPHFGYESVQDYYSDAMSLPYLEHAAIPTLCLGCADDTVTGHPPTLRRWESLCQRNPNVVYVQAPAGGHLGFLGNPLAELYQLPNFGEQVTLNAASAVCMSLKTGGEEVAAR